MKTRWEIAKIIKLKNILNFTKGHSFGSRNIEFRLDLNIVRVLQVFKHLLVLKMAENVTGNAKVNKSKGMSSAELMWYTKRTRDIISKWNIYIFLFLSLKHCLNAMLFLRTRDKYVLFKNYQKLTGSLNKIHKIERPLSLSSCDELMWAAADPERWRRARKGNSLSWINFTGFRREIRFTGWFLEGNEW